jgi:outer membrane protein OmpA-like peptidoglycan-associated protein
MNQVYAALKDQGFPPIRIEGHTDSVGSADENRKLSLARADSVKAHLVSQGYPSNKIETAGLGPDRPVADNGTPEGRANNRRVEIIVNPKK